MDYRGIFKQAWQNVRHYRALWIFGAILALTTFSLEAAVFYSFDNDGRKESRGIEIVTQEDENFYEAFRRTVREGIDELDGDIDRANRELDAFLADELDINVESNILAIIAALAGVMLLGYSLAKIAGYVSQVALIRMVDETEESGDQYSARQGLRMGWSRAAWRILLINLLVNVTALLAIILLFLLVMAPLALWTTGNTPAGVIGTVITVVLFFPSIAVVIVAAVTLSMFKQFFHRACALEGLGVIASIRHGFGAVRRHVREVIPVWLVTMGVNLAWPLFIAPVALLMAVVAVLLGGAAALLAGGLASLAFAGATPWVVAGAVGFPLFILTWVAPLAFLGGLAEVFLSSTWTLTYRELRAVQSLQPAPKRRVDPSGLEAASII